MCRACSTTGSCWGIDRLSKQFWIFLVVGLAVVFLAVAGIMMSTKSAHLDLTGNILKVRTLALGANATVVILDFRVTNPSGLPFVVRDVTMRLEPPSGEPVEGSQLSKSDVDNVFKYEKLAGTKFNDVLSLRDKVPAGQTLDRMSAARFELPEAEIQSRKRMVLHLEDVDGPAAEITEKQ